jgi:hypothetical protein
MPCMPNELRNASWNHGSAAYCVRVPHCGWVLRYPMALCFISRNSAENLSDT